MTMCILLRRCGLISYAVLASLTLQLTFSVTGYAQEATPQAKAGLQATSSNQIAAPTEVDHLIITPRVIKGKKLSEQLERRNDSHLSSIAARSLSIERQLSGKSHLLKLDRAVSLDEARALAAKLSTNTEVESVEPDVRMQAHAFMPNDPGYSGAPGQWHFMTPIGSNAGGADLPPAWDMTLGNGTVEVTVLDTGYRPHSDLQAVLPGYDFVSSVAIANDGNGRDADASDPGDAVVANECGRGAAAARSSWHGTHVMGIIAALMNNGLYGTGMAPNVRIVPVRVLGKCGGYTSDIIDGMRWAAGLAVPGAPKNAYPARIINLSLGIPGTCSRAFQAAINDVNAAGAIVVVSNGNGGYSSVNQPANCAGTLAVTAHSVDGDSATYANLGVQTLISAPGGGCGTLARNCVEIYSSNGLGIYSLGNTGASRPASDGYSIKYGTSMAAPHVSGAIALMLSLNPSLSRDEVVSLLRASARAFPAGSACLLRANSGMCGAGILDVYAALTSIAPAIHIANLSQVASPGALVNLDASAISPSGHQVISYEWHASPSNKIPISVLNADTANASFVAPATGTYQFVVLVTDSSGTTSNASATVRINSAPVIQSVTTHQVAAGKTLTIKLVAMDADGNKPVFHAIALPDGATLSAAGVFNRAHASPMGIYTISVAASDMDATGSTMSFTVEVPQGLQTSAGVSSGSSSGGGGAIDVEWLIAITSLLVVTRCRRVF
ncbi:MAG: S8 family peptidase [Polynucleobacter sp.]|nr:S8 family peptidase [Polynucleobacter sp.]